MLNINEILDRIKESLEIKSEAALTRLFGLPEQANLKMWRKRGTIPWIELYNLCADKGWSFEWLLTGKEKELKTCDVECNTEMAEWCKKVKKILESKTKYGDALKENIDAFLLSVEAKEEAKREMREFEDNIQTQIEAMKVIYEREIESIKQEFENYRRTHSEGRKADTPEDPVGGIGSNE